MARASVSALLQWQKRRGECGGQELIGLGVWIRDVGSSHGQSRRGMEADGATLKRREWVVRLDCEHRPCEGGGRAGRWQDQAKRRGVCVYFLSCSHSLAANNTGQVTAPFLSPCFRQGNIPAWWFACSLHALPHFRQQQRAMRRLTCKVLIESRRARMKRCVAEHSRVRPCASHRSEGDPSTRLRTRGAS